MSARDVSAAAALAGADAETEAAGAAAEALGAACDADGWVDAEAEAAGVDAHEDSMPTTNTTASNTTSAFFICFSSKNL
jgi:hypothetical protein